MGILEHQIFCYVILVFFLLVNLHTFIKQIKDAEITQVNCKKKKNSMKMPNKNETNLFNFLKLVLYRLIYGFATMFGAQESVSDFMEGILVPPGAEDGDYRDYLDDEYKHYEDSYYYT